MAKITTITATANELPVSVPISIVRGDTFLGPLYRHPKADGTYEDTSGWTVTGAIYSQQACGAVEIIPLTIVHLPAPEYGYQPTLTKTQVLTLECANNWYTLPTFDGALDRTYFGGPAKISGVG